MADRLTGESRPVGNIETRRTLVGWSAHQNGVAVHGYTRDEAIFGLEKLRQLIVRLNREWESWRSRQMARRGPGR